LGIALDNLASLYAEHARLAEAEQLRLRALQIFRATLDPASPHIAATLQNLAVLYQYQGRLPQALEAYLQALAVTEKAYGPDSRQVAVVADNLAGLYRSQRQFDKAEALYLRAISAFEKSVGGDHPDTALALQNYAIQLSQTGRYEAAEARLKQALVINERLYGPDHATVAAALNTLVLQYISQQRWRDALETSRRAAKLHVQLAARGKVSPPSEGGQRGSPFRRLVQAAHSLDPSDPALMDESYMAAQRALHTDASLALSQLAARHGAGSGALASLVREQQDLLQELEARDRLLVAAVAKPPSQRDGNGEAALRARVAEIASRMDEIGLQLGRQFPGYAALSQPAPLSIAATQALLQPDEALIQFLDVQSVGSIPETGFAWLITKTDAQWVRLPVGSGGLARAVAALRCGLDAAQWLDGGAKRCRELLKVDAPASGAPLPFNLETAHGLYQALLSAFAAKIEGKHLLVVPSGALTTLPLSVLVAAKPEHAVPRTPEGYRKAVWLGLRQPITVLPSAVALKDLRELAKNSGAKRPYLGVGNPLLDGPQADTRYGPYYREQAQAARAKQRCPSTAPVRTAAAVARRAARLDDLFRGRKADREAIRQLTPLPETADEVCEIGRRLGVPERELLLGARATETALKELSAQGRLADYRVLHFATHGALAGEVKGSAEPGLILTPPAGEAKDATGAGRRDDDGFLATSEIATLKLDANWVVLSACNTAGGSGGSTEALSGMARAFFYAGARALLVSHWAVDSYAAVKLTTKAFDVLKSRPAAGRAEALRLAMRDLVERGAPAEWHPSHWAPFVVVGEGAGAPPAHSVPKEPAQPKAPPSSDWTTEIRQQ
jgi:CHAT domain-containing protein/tetratricopeptide (TPR) repeat protein